MLDFKHFEQTQNSSTFGKHCKEIEPSIPEIPN